MLGVIAECEKRVKLLTKTDSITASQMFGKPRLKINSKAFVAQHQKTAVLKLTSPQHEKASALKGAKLLDSSGKGRPIKELAAIPVSENKNFKALAMSSFGSIVKSLVALCYPATNILDTSAFIERTLQANTTVSGCQ